MSDHSDNEGEAFSGAPGVREADVETERPERKRSLLGDLSDSSLEPSSKHQKTSASLAQDLFGTDDEDENDDEVEEKKSANKGSDAGDSGDDEEKPTSSDVEDEREREARKMGANYTDLFGDEEDEEDSRERSTSRSPSPEVEKRIVDLEVANMGAPHSSEKKLYLSKLPNFLSIDPRPFHPETYEEELRNSEDTSLEENKTMKLKVGNTIRWRINNQEGKPPTYESNARFVRWSDGSLSLLVGSELFEATTSDILRDRQYLVAHHPKEGVLQTQAKFTTTMGFRPHTLQSGTHKMLTTAIMQKHKKTIRTKYVEMEGDPEQEKLEAEQRESERLKARRRLEGSRRRTNARFADGGLTEAHLEGDLSDDNDSRRRTGSYGSRGSGRGNYGQNIKESEELDGYEEDEGFVVDDDEVEAEEREKRIMRAKRTQNQRKARKPRDDSEDDDEDMSDAESEEDDEEESEQDEEEDEEEVVVARKPKRAIAVALDDEED